MKKKILIVTPKFPFPKTGACEQDRGYGIEDLIRLGHDVRIITKIAQDKMVNIEKESQRLGVKIAGIPYLDRQTGSKFKRIINRVLQPWKWDGAAAEYYDPKIQRILSEELTDFKPDVVWFDYTYLWPLYKIVRKHNIPIITRSINFEPLHFLEEDGMNIKNLILFLPKLVSEIIVTLKSDLVLSITPQEERMYRILGGCVRNLPLRGLPHLLPKKHEVKDTETLHVFFFGSTYNVYHNRQALDFLLKEVIPLVHELAPHLHVFHILGSKIPPELEKLCTGNVVYEGYVTDLEVFLQNMDIAIIPSLMGRGMQQKIFEPLVRGIPTITSARGLAGYPFVSPRDYRAATTAAEFAQELVSLQDYEIRKNLSHHSRLVSENLFSLPHLDSIVEEAINQVVRV